MSTPHDDQLLTLIDGEPTDALNLLRDDPAARRRYLDLVALQIMLHEKLEGEQKVAGVQGSGFGVQRENSKFETRNSKQKITAQPRFAAGESSSFVFRVPSFIAAVAAIIALALTAWFLFSPEPRTLNPEPSAVPAAAVAMLSDLSADATFADAAEPMKLGGDLSRGSLDLVSGTAQVMFRSGAVVDLIGPCSLEMTGNNRGFLRRGTLTAFVSEPARGFTVEAPRGVKVVDLGTRFLMSVDSADNTELVVLEGLVQLSGVNPADPLKAGCSAVIADDWVRVYRPGPGEQLALPPRASRPLINGDLETGTTDFKLRGNVGRATNSHRAWQGSAYLSFNVGNAQPNGIVEQTLATIAGMTYELRFDLAKYLQSAGAAQLNVDVLTESGGTTLLHETAAVTEGSADLPVKPVHFTYRFTAHGPTTLLRFTDTSTNHASAFDAYLDNIRIQPVMPNTPSDKLIQENNQEF
jgi:hypothetical protein